MDLGRPIRVVEIPERKKAGRPSRPAPPKREQPIPLPADWPIRRKVAVPVPVEVEWTGR